MVLLISKHQLCVNHAFVTFFFSKSVVHVPSWCLLHTWNNDCAVPDISVLSSTFEITQLAVEKGENMITNYLSFCSGSFYCMPFNSRRCSRPMHRLNHRSKPLYSLYIVCDPSKPLTDLLKYRKSWLSLGTSQYTITIRIAREYLIRVCTCNVGERPVSLSSSVLSLFCVSYTLLSAPMALAFFAAPFSHGLKA